MKSKTHYLVAALLMMLAGLAIMLLAWPVLAQDSGSAGYVPFSPERVFAELGRLQVQVSVLQDYVENLHAQVAKLQAENAKLKKTLEPEK